MRRPSTAPSGPSSATTLISRTYTVLSFLSYTVVYSTLVSLLHCRIQYSHCFATLCSHEDFLAPQQTHFIFLSKKLTLHMVSSSHNVHGRCHTSHATCHLPCHSPHSLHMCHCHEVNSLRPALWGPPFDLSLLFDCSPDAAAGHCNVARGRRCHSRSRERCGPSWGVRQPPGQGAAAGTGEGRAITTALLFTTRGLELTRI